MKETMSYSEAILLLGRLRRHKEHTTANQGKQNSTNDDEHHQNAKSFLRYISSTQGQVTQI